MKKTKQLHLVKETVRNLVPSELSQIQGGGGISIFTESRVDQVGGHTTTGSTSSAAPHGSVVTN